MSQTLIDRSSDLSSLVADGYDIQILDGYVILKDVPYVTSEKKVERADLFCPLDLAGDVTLKPSNHVAYWTGSDPCDSNGEVIAAFQNPSGPTQLGRLTANKTFSARADYRDFRHKLLTYAGRMEAEAQAIDPNATARHFRLYIQSDIDSVFNYIDNASSRSELVTLNQKMIGQKVCIIGVGGTGSYVLDFVSKCEGVSITIYDADTFQQHNAFRAPGAFSRDVIAGEFNKAVLFKHTYQALRREVVALEHRIDESNIHELYGFDFVFVCIDNPVSRKFICEELLRKGIPFVDVGLGVTNYGDALGGIVRVTRGFGFANEQILSKMPLAEREDPENLYRANAQVVELNALNAAMAVIAWKKSLGYYRDSNPNPYEGYSIAAGTVVQDT